MTSMAMGMANTVQNVVEGIITAALAGLSGGVAIVGDTLTINVSDGTPTAYRWRTSTGLISGEIAQTYTVAAALDQDTVSGEALVGSAWIVSASVTVQHVAPQVAPPLPAASVVQGQGDVLVDYSGYFSGLDLTFSISGLAGVSIDPSTGVATYPDTLDVQTETLITITATNSGGSVFAALSLDVQNNTGPVVSSFSMGPQDGAGGNVPAAWAVEVYNATREPYDLFFTIWDAAIAGVPDANQIEAGLDPLGNAAADDFSITGINGAVASTDIPGSLPEGTYRAAMFVRDALGSVSDVALSAATFGVVAAPAGPAFTVTDMPAAANEGFYVSPGGTSVQWDMEGLDLPSKQAGDKAFGWIGPGDIATAVTFNGRPVDKLISSGGVGSLQYMAYWEATITAGDVAGAGGDVPLVATFQFGSNAMYMRVAVAAKGTGDFVIDDPVMFVENFNPGVTSNTMNAAPSNANNVAYGCVTSDDSAFPGVWLNMTEIDDVEAVRGMSVATAEDVTSGTDLTFTLDNQNRMSMCVVTISEAP